MSFNSARRGRRLRATARPPQKGSTRRLARYSVHRSARYGTSHRLPPAHFRGGRTASSRSQTSTSAAIAFASAEGRGRVRKEERGGSFSELLKLFPFDGCGRFVGHVKEHRID